MPTVVSSRALVPIGRRIPNAPEDSDASKAIVLRRKQDGETEDLSKALIIIRPADDGKDDRQALVLYRQKGGQEALKEMAQWHKSSALLPPFRLEELLRVSDSQFMANLNELQNLQDPLYFYDVILETIQSTREYALFKHSGGDDPLQNQSWVTSMIASRIHNAYFRTASWKYVRDHAKLLHDLGLEDLNVYAQLKANPGLCTAYLEVYQMLKVIEASGQHELGLLASACPHYMKHLKEVDGTVAWDPEAGYKLHKSLIDTILMEMIFPQSNYELSILMLCLRDAIALGGDDKTTGRFTQDVFDAIGDLSVTLQLLDMMETPVSASDAKAWRQSQSQNINAAFSAVTKSSQAAANHVTGIGAWVVPLTKTKAPATLEKIWETVNATYVARAGMDVDILWGLEDSMNPEPQWSAWALTRTHTSETKLQLLVQKTRPHTPKKKKRLAIAAQAAEDDIPGLVSSSEEEESEEEEEEEGGFSDEDELDEQESRYWDSMLRAQTKNREQSPQDQGNPFATFATLFRSLKGRFLTKDPILSVEPAVEVDGQPGKKKKKPKKKAAGEDNMPGLIPAYSYKDVPLDMPALIPLSVASERLKNKPATASGSEPKAPAKKTNVMVEEVEDADARRHETNNKKKKKKKKKVVGERPRTPPPPESQTRSPQAAQSQSPGSPTPGASMSTLYTPQPETGQSGLSYLKSTGIGIKTKTKSRPEGESKLEKLGTFMSRTFGRGAEPAKDSERVEDKVSGVAERLAAYMKSVHARAVDIWRRILGVDETKGQAGLEWNEFVKAMIDLGFEYDESSAGSRVRFDPPDQKDKSYTVHKPHPDPWLHPKRVKAVARDLRKMYGFDERMLEM